MAEVRKSSLNAGAPPYCWETKGVWQLQIPPTWTIAQTCEPTNDISFCSDSYVVGVYQWIQHLFWLLRCMSANANSMDMRWAELAELAELGAEKGNVENFQWSGDWQDDSNARHLWRVFTLGGGGSGERCQCDSTEAVDYHLIRWRAWLDIHPEIPISSGVWEISSFDRTVFNTDIDSIGGVEIKRYHKDILPVFIIIIIIVYYDY